MTSRDQLVHAAFELFGARGFDQTTVDDIAARAGVSRATFFRLFASKEAVIFPDHDALLAKVEARLAAGEPGRAPAALFEAARLVLRHYLAEGERARQRYALTRDTPALRDAEIAIQRRYQQVFRNQLRLWLIAEGRPDDIRAEVIANAVVVIHNHVLRSWLRSEPGDPEDRLRTAIISTVDRLDGDAADPSSTQIVLLRTTKSIGDLLPQLQALLS